MDKLKATLPCALLLAVFICGLIPNHRVLAQSNAGAAKSPLCSRQNAIDLIKQQIEVKTFSSTVRRISVLIRAADLLWPYQQDKARAVFADAFDLATEDEKDNQRKSSQSIILRMQTPDQRYVVIRAVAKRDSAWAKELAKQVLKRAEDNEPSSTRSSIENVLSGSRLLDTAYSLIDTDSDAAFDLAMLSLNYPAGFLLTRYLYRLAAVNQHAADQFYAQALSMYGNKPIQEFLYLEAYPFAWSDTLDTPVFAHHDVPPNFRTNENLQRRFVQILLSRAQQALELIY